jgi:hypothetical protein
VIAVDISVAATLLRPIGSLVREARVIYGNLYDGIYQGTLTELHGNAPNCSSQGSAQIVVNGDWLTFTLDNSMIRMRVALDGSFFGIKPHPNGLPGYQVLQGKITGTALSAKADMGKTCSYTLSLGKLSEDMPRS